MVGTEYRGSHGLATRLQRRGFLNSAFATAASVSGLAGTANVAAESRIVDVKVFGARADGQTNDAPAINAAIQHLRENYSRTGDFNVSPKLLFPTGTYAVTETINLTALQDINLVIDGDSSVIIGLCFGQPVIDALASRWLTVRDLTIIGDKNSPPTIGIQIGIANDGNVADDHVFENVKILGHYSLTCILNQSAETTEFNHIFLWNDFISPESYCLIQDGVYHFRTTSSFISVHNRGRDTDDSFNENVFINCDFRHGGGGIPIWLGDTARHQFIRCYAAGVGVASFALYCGTNSHTMLDIDCHCEGKGLKSVFLLISQAAAPVIRGFSYKDHGTFAADFVFQRGGSIDKAGIWNARIEIGGFVGGTGRVFDDPRRWEVTGSYFSPEFLGWNGAECFTGIALLGNRFIFYGNMGLKIQSGTTRQRPPGLVMSDAGRLFHDRGINKLIIWTGTEWLDTLGGKV